MNLDYTERRGRLAYMVGIYAQQMDGWFRLSTNGKYIEARKLRGRNRWSLCSVEDFAYFEEAK